MGRALVCFSVFLVGCACAPATTGEAESAAQQPTDAARGEDSPAGSDAGEQDEAGEAGEAEAAEAAEVAASSSSEAPEAAAPEAAAPEVADSDLRPGLHLEPGERSGLAAFAAELDAAGASKGALWVGPLEGNGGRDVLIYIPPGAEDAAPFELVFHFHGTYSEVVAKQTESMERKREWVGWERATQTVEAMAELQAARPFNVALVYPLSAGKRLEPGHRGWSNVAYDREWMNPVAPPDYRDDFGQLYDEVVAVLDDHMGVHPSKLPDGVIAEGHSAGGIALLNIALNGSAHVREYIFLDASFQTWADGCYGAVKHSKSSAEVILIVTDKGMADPFEGRDPWCLDMEQDAALWAQHRSWCAKRADEEVPDSDWTCAELEERAHLWDDVEHEWCAALQNGMQDLDGVTLIETSVYHKDMPRRFSGGLGLSEDHHSAADSR